MLSEILREEGHDVRVAESASQARQQRSRAAPDLVLLDIWMPDSDGVTLLKEWAAKGQLTMPVVMMSGHGTIDTAVEATRIGAYAYLEKPIALQKLLSTVGSALARRDSQPALTPTLVTLGKSSAVTQLLAQLERVEPLDIRVNGAVQRIKVESDTVPEVGKFLEGVDQERAVERCGAVMSN